MRWVLTKVERCKMMTSIVSDILSELRSNVDAAYLKRSKGFFKEEVHSMGVRVPTLRAIAKKHFAHIKTLDKEGVFLICEELLDWRRCFSSNSQTPL
jgi:hypothetical protein